MEKLNSIISGPEYAKIDLGLTKEGDLIYHEGPFLSHFKDEKGLNYLMNWVDKDEKFNRWLLISVYEDQFNDFIEGKESLLGLVMSNQMVVFLDYDDDMDIARCHVVGGRNIPESYRPGDDSFVRDMEHYTDYAKSLRSASLLEFLTYSLSLVKKLYVPDLDPPYQIMNNTYFIEIPEELDNATGFQNICGEMIKEVMEKFPDKSICFITSNSLTKITNPSKFNLT